MMRFKFTRLLGAIALLAAVGCGQTPTSSNAGSPQPDSISTAPADLSAAPTQDGYSQLLIVVAKTQAAVDTNDFAKAQQAFDQFEAAWAPVEDGIRAQSDATYDAIEQGMDQVNAALRAAQADPAIAALQAMSDQIVSLLPASASVSTQGASTPALAQGSYPKLLTVVAKTQAAVTANDFAKAQQEFDQFESVWAPVEDGIRAKSDVTYDAIEQGMDQVNTALRSAQADPAIAALQAMSEQIQSIPQN